MKRNRTSPILLMEKVTNQRFTVRRRTVQIQKNGGCWTVQLIFGYFIRICTILVV